jgi:hypothetical protein
MPYRRLIALNLALVAAVGIFGLVTDEPYWRSNGHDPRVYDYLFWFALALNGPSGFVADWLSWALGLEMDVHFFAQYVLWMALLAVQWFAYVRLSKWAAPSRARRRGVCVAAGFLALVGCVIAASVWATTQPSTEYFVDVWFWPVRIAALALSGAWVALLLRNMRSNPPLQGTPAGKPAAPLS